MKTIIFVTLLLCSVAAMAGTAILCHPDGTCDIIITQE